jgi:hypothetical protein
VQKTICLEKILNHSNNNIKECLKTKVILAVVIEEQEEQQNQVEEQEDIVKI